MAEWDRMVWRKHNFLRFFNDSNRDDNHPSPIVKTIAPGVSVLSELQAYSLDFNSINPSFEG